MTIDSTALTLRAASGDSLTFGLDALTRLQVHRSTGPDTLSQVGAAGTLVGFLAGAAIGAMACSGAEDNSWVSTLPELCGFGVGLGGALLGARVAGGDAGDAGWRPVSLPLRPAFRPGPGAGLRVAVFF